MNEKEIKIKFVSDWLGNFQQVMKLPSVRLYAMEFPIKHGKEEYRVDILLEEDEFPIPMDNQLFVLEFKKDKIFHSALDQLNLYCETVGKKLYRKKEVIGMLAAPEFSTWEQQEAERQGRKCLQYDLNGNMRIL